VLRAVISPDAAAISAGRALVTLSIYGLVAVAVAGIALSRRDITS